MVARYYRAPEIILGTQIKPSETYAIDVWAMGCSLFELYTNQFLFNGNSNNDMLKLMMETKGKFSIKMINKSIFKDKHFDNDLNFLHHEVDNITKEPK
jgi:serine/threonine-protein kinase PRP4